MLKNDLSISQNFFKDISYVKSLVEKSDILQNDLVIDIGSGKGIITDVLLEKRAKVISIEKDANLYEQLVKKYLSNTNVKVVSSDFLNYNFPDSKYKIFANIPFNLSSDILNKILSLPNKLDSAFLVLQDKTAERFIGLPNYISTQVSVIHKPFFEMRIIDSIPNEMFVPRPKVDTVLMGIKRKDIFEVDLKNYQLYRDFVTYIFNQRNAEVFETLKRLFTNFQLKHISKNFDIQIQKPSQLTMVQWLGLFNTFVSYGKDRLYLVRGYELKHNQSHLNRIKRKRTNI